MENQANLKEAVIPTQEIDFGKMLKIIRSRWYWILGTVIIALGIAWLYLWYTPKVYSTSANIKIENKNQLNSVVGLSNGVEYENKIQSESWVFKSRQVILNALNHLEWQISYYLEGKVRTTELYPNKPFSIQILKQDSVFYTDLIRFEPLSDKQFKISYPIGESQEVKTLSYGSAVKLPGVEFFISKPESINNSSVYNFKFNTRESWYNRMVSGFAIEESAKLSSVANLVKSDQNPDFAADALNAIIKEYLAEDLLNKSRSASQIIEFIDAQLDFLQGKVNSTGKALEDYKQNEQLFDISSSASQVLDKLNNLESQKSLLKIQLLAIEQLEEQILKDKENVNLNFNLEGNIDPLLGSLVGQLNTLLLQRKQLQTTYTPNSQPLNEIQAQIAEIRRAAFENIKATKQRITKSIEYYDQQLNRQNAALGTLPVKERQLFNLNRDYQVNEKIYNLLLEKKLEAQINKASIISGATLIDAAIPNRQPISPGAAAIWRSAFILGILGGIGLIFLARSMNPYIYDKETVESLTTIPILGIIRRYDEKAKDENIKILAVQKPKSIFAESVWSVRTNLSFLANEVNSKVICITSEISGEGKSFVAANLAGTMALIDKKVLLIAADLRRSKLHKTFKTKNDKGLSSYLSNQAGLEEILFHTDHENLDFITSGPVPPNPSELLHSRRFIELLDQVRASYDIIIIDTAPVGLVSDAVPIIRLSDINVFVIRAGVSKLSAASVPQRIDSEYQVNNTVIVFNAFYEEYLYSRYYSASYPAGYKGAYYYSDYSGNNNNGYYTDEQSKEWWKFWKRG